MYPYVCLVQDTLVTVTAGNLYSSAKNGRMLALSRSANYNTHGVMRNADKTIGRDSWKMAMNHAFRQAQQPKYALT
jgi:hypothetical protein